jgi:hypothetical protein
MSTTYRIEVSAEESANFASNRAGLWEAAPGESTGYTSEMQALRAANACLEIEGIKGARVVVEQTGEVLYAV